MSDYEERMTLCADLQEYAQVEGTEIGEMCSLLISVAQYTSYMSDEFVKKLTSEMQEHLLHFKANYTIEETTETQTITYKELVETKSATPTGGPMPVCSRH